MKKVHKLSPYQLQNRTIEQEVFERAAKKKKFTLIADGMYLLVTLFITDFVLSRVLLTWADKGVILGSVVIVQLAALSREYIKEQL